MNQNRRARMIDLIHEMLDLLDEEEAEERGERDDTCTAPAVDYSAEHVGGLYTRSDYLRGGKG